MIYDMIIALNIWIHKQLHTTITITHNTMPPATEHDIWGSGDDENDAGADVDQEQDEAGEDGGRKRARRKE